MPRFGGQSCKDIFSCVYKSRPKGHKVPLGWSLAQLLWVIGYSEEVLVDEQDLQYIDLWTSLGKVHYKIYWHGFSLELTVVHQHS